MKPVYASTPHWAATLKADHIKLVFFCTLLTVVGMGSLLLVVAAPGLAGGCAWLLWLMLGSPPLDFQWPQGAAAVTLLGVVFMAWAVIALHLHRFAMGLLPTLQDLHRERRALKATLTTLKKAQDLPEPALRGNPYHITPDMVSMGGPPKSDTPPEEES